MAENTVPTTINNGQCSLNLSNESIQDVSTNQKGAAALSSIMNNNLVNDLTSKYKFSATQTNEGFDPADIIRAFGDVILAALLPFIIAIVVIGIVGVVFLKSGAIPPFMKGPDGKMSSKAKKGFAIAVGILVALAIIIIPSVLYAKCVLPDKPESCKE
jgi:hypothetical protein